MMTLFDRLAHYLNAHPLRALAWWLLLTLTLIFVASSAWAGDMALTLTQPTQNTDGTTIPASGVGRLIGNRFEWGSCAGTAPNYTFGTKAGEQAFTVPTTVYTVVNLLPGTHCARAYASTTYAESAPTNVVSKVIAVPVPNAPSPLVVTGTQVYHIQKREDRFVMLPVGTVPAGTQCDETQSINGYYVVPRALVTWSGTIKPPVVVSPCS